MSEKIINMVINHFKKSPALNAAVSAVDGALDFLNDTFDFVPIDIAQLAKKLSPAIDQMILTLEKDEVLQFVAGKLQGKTSDTDVKNFQLNLQLYFKDNNGKFILKETAKTLPLLLVTDESKFELAKSAGISFEINHPLR